MKIYVLLANGFEEIEAITLIDLMRRANYNVTTVSIEDKAEVTGSHNITVKADSTINKESFDDLDALVIPGGPAVPNIAENTTILNLTKKCYENEKYICAICAGPFVLEKAGILKNKNITCYPSWAPKMVDANVHDKKAEADGKIITGNGVGGAIEMGLKMVEVFSSREEAEDLAEKILYEI